MNEKPVEIFRFVRHANVQAFIDAGWEPLRSLEGTHHGEWSRLMKWPHDDRPPANPTEIPLAG